MELSTNLWYVRYFFFCHETIYNFLMKSFYQKPTKSNLCQFMRAILFGTIITIMNVGVCLYTVYVFLFFPIVYGGASSIFTSIALFILFVAFVVICICGFFSMLNKMGKYLENRKHEPVNPSAKNVFIQYLWSIKNKICPTIKFMGDV